MSVYVYRQFKPRQTEFDKIEIHYMNLYITTSKKGKNFKGCPHGKVLCFGNKLFWPQ